MRTLHVELLKGWSGGQVQCLALAEGLAARGHETRIACPPDSALAERAAGRVEVAPLPWRRQLGWQPLRRLIHLLRELRPEVVHLHSAHAHSLGALAARVVKTPVVVASKRTDFAPRPGRLNRLRYQRWVDRVIAISEGARQAVINSGISPEAVVTIHSSVDCARFRPAHDRSAARAALGLSDHELIVGSVGELIPRKGHHLLLAAAPTVLQAAPHTRFVICGAGPQRAHLEHQADTLGAAERVIFTGFRQEAEQVLSAFDLFAFPSLEEGLGVALLEALAVGLPVVASAVGGIPEAVADGVNGLLVPPGDSAQLAAAIIRLAGDPLLRERLSAAARETALSRFSREVMISRTEELYRRLLESKLARLAR